MVGYEGLEGMIGWINMIVSEVHRAGKLPYRDRSGRLLCSITVMLAESLKVLQV